MKVLVTGASGFLGRKVVEAVTRAGHMVAALVRPTSDVSFLQSLGSVETLQGDLRERGPWCDELGGVEAVIHLAAVLEGDLPTQFAGTVVTTENLLRWLPLGALRRFVHVSSFSVYDYQTLPERTTLTELSPVEREPLKRDAYTTTKIVQEQLVVAACRSAGVPCVVLRPRAVYGPGHLWKFGRAAKFGKFDVIVAPFAAFKLTYVENCADAICQALTADCPSEAVINVVDDDLPSHLGFYNMCRKAGAKSGYPLLIPWRLAKAIGWGADVINRAIFKGRARLPTLLAAKRQHAMWKPLSYSNATAKRSLHWVPKVSSLEGIRRSISSPRQDN